MALGNEFAIIYFLSNRKLNLIQPLKKSFMLQTEIMSAS